MRRWETYYGMLLKALADFSEELERNFGTKWLNVVERSMTDPEAYHNAYSYI
jgi:hypothetical protein